MDPEKLNSEKTETIRQVREVLNSITVKIPDFPLHSIERNKLLESSTELETVLLKIIEQDILLICIELSVSGARLKDVAAELSSINEKLSSISQEIKKVAQTIARLVEIAGAASTLGII